MKKQNKLVINKIEMLFIHSLVNHTIKFNKKAKMDLAKIKLI